MPVKLSLSRRTVLKTLAASAATAGAPLAFAQSFPSRPIELVVPTPPGGSTDVVGRMLATRISAILGQPVLITNRAGAGGNIGTAFVARSPADGYRLVMAPNGTVAINPHLTESAGFNPFKDLAPVSLICNGANALAVHAESNIRTLQDLVAEARRNPKGLFYATPSAGTPQHLMGELLAEAAGIKLAPVHYKGFAPALTDLLGGAVPILSSTYASLKPHVEAGKVRVLAVGTKERVAIAPQIPTVAETIPGFEVNLWFGIFAPAGIPATVLARLEDAFVQAVASKDAQDLLNSLALPPVGSTATQLAQVLRRDYDVLGKLIREKHITAE